MIATLGLTSFGEQEEAAFFSRWVSLVHLQSAQSINDLDHCFF